MSTLSIILRRTLINFRSILRSVNVKRNLCADVSEDGSAKGDEKVLN